MKMKHFLGYLVILLVLFSSCKKEIQISENSGKEVEIKSGLDNNHTRTSFINGDHVRSWLNSSLDTSTGDRNTLITRVLSHLLTDNMYVETLDDDVNLVIIPLSSDSISRHTIGQGDLAPFLLLREDGKSITRGEIAVFKPVDPRDIVNHALPENSFRDFFQSDPIKISGTLGMITLDDVKQYEMDSDSGRNIQFRQWFGRAPIIPSEECLDWFLVTTYYNADGTTWTDWVFLYQTCPGSGGGGGGPLSDEWQNGTPSTVTRTLNARNTQHERVFQVFSLSGTRFLNTGMNVFSGITNVGTPDMQYYFTGGGTGDIWYSTISTSTVTFGLNANAIGWTSAWGRLQGALHFWNQNYNPPFDNITIWQASIVL